MYRLSTQKTKPIQRSMSQMGKATLCIDCLRRNWGVCSRAAAIVLMYSIKSTSLYTLNSVLLSRDIRLYVTILRLCVRVCLIKRVVCMSDRERYSMCLWVGVFVCMCMWLYVCMYSCVCGYMSVCIHVYVCLVLCLSVRFFV